jgi:hypothetical protein
MGEMTGNFNQRWQLTFERRLGWRASVVQAASKLVGQEFERITDRWEMRLGTFAGANDQIQVLRQLMVLQAEGFTNQPLPTIAMGSTTYTFGHAQAQS